MEDFKEAVKDFVKKSSAFDEEVRETRSFPPCQTNSLTIDLPLFLGFQCCWQDCYYGVIGTASRLTERIELQATGYDRNGLYQQYSGLQQKGKDNIFQAGDYVSISFSDKNEVVGRITRFFGKVGDSASYFPSPPVAQGAEMLGMKYFVKNGYVEIEIDDDEDDDDARRRETATSKPKKIFSVRFLVGVLTKAQAMEMQRQIAASQYPKHLHCLTLDPDEQHLDDLDWRPDFQWVRGETIFNVALYSARIDGRRKRHPLGKKRLKVVLEAFTGEDFNTKLSLSVGKKKDTKVEAFWKDADQHLVLALPAFKLPNDVRGEVKLTFTCVGPLRAGLLTNRSYIVNVVPGEAHAAIMAWWEADKREDPVKVCRMEEVLPKIRLMLVDQAGGSVLTADSLPDLKVSLYASSDDKVST